MDYEAIDKDMSSYVISCRLRTTTLFLTDEGVATDILGRARRRQRLARAGDAAIQAMREKAWRGFEWSARRVAGIVE